MLKEQIEIKYSNKILLHVGLCITFYDFVSIGDPYIYPSEGSSIQIVKFRMVVFRPFAGEIMTGKLISSNREGLKISVDFFDDILIPAALLQAPCVYNPVDGLWTWKYGENHDTDFVMDIGEEVGYILLFILNTVQLFRVTILFIYLYCLLLLLLLRV